MAEVVSVAPTPLTGAALRAAGKRLAELHATTKTCERTWLLTAWEAGRLLSEVKESLPYGAWGAWLLENFSGSRMEAWRYMKVWETIGPDVTKAIEAADTAIRAICNKGREPTDKEKTTAPISMRLKDVIDSTIDYLSNAIGISRTSVVERMTKVYHQAFDVVSAGGAAILRHADGREETIDPRLLEPSVEREL